MIDLKATYGMTYRVVLEETAAIEGQTREDRLWLYRIPCKGKDHIYVHGTATLGGYCGRSKKIRDRLKAIPGVKVHQDGDRECIVIFPPEVLPQVAEVLGAKKRRQLSEEHRQRLSESNARYRFSSRFPDPNQGSNLSPNESGG
jgi:hypothetical protein